MHLGLHQWPVQGMHEQHGTGVLTYTGTWAGGEGSRRKQSSLTPAYGGHGAIGRGGEGGLQESSLASFLVGEVGPTRNKAAGMEVSLSGRTNSKQRQPTFAHQLQLRENTSTNVHNSRRKKKYISYNSYLKMFHVSCLILF